MKALLTLALALALALAATTVAAGDYPGSREESCRNFDIAIADKPTLRIVNGNGIFEITRQKKKKFSGTRDGVPLDRQAFRMDGRILSVLEADGSTVLMVGFLPGGLGNGQLVYTPDMDPTSLTARYGLDVTPLDEEIAAHLDVAPGTALVVSDVCRGLPAEHAGIRENDVILAVNGRAPATLETLTRGSAKTKLDEPLRLSLLRRGQREETSLQGLDLHEWPEPDRLQAYFRQALQN
jgi:hypothetical protein